MGRQGFAVKACFGLHAAGHPFATRAISRATALPRPSGNRSGWVQRVYTASWTTSTYGLGLCASWPPLPLHRGSAFADWVSYWESSLTAQRYAWHACWMLTRCHAAPPSIPL